jgi:hypothetical protein
MFGCKPYGFRQRSTKEVCAMPENATEEEARYEEKDSTPLSDNLGALAVSLVLFIAGGLLVASGWGTVAQVVGAIIAMFGLITGRVTFWAILKSLF